METEEIYQRSKLNVNTYRLICYSLVALMMGCAASTIVSLVNHIIAEPPTYLIWLCFLIALDRLYTFRVFRNWMILSREWLVLFGTQAIIIIVLTKITVGLSHGLGAFLAEIPTWREKFPASFLDPETGFALILALLVWVLCGNFADMLEEIGPDQLQSRRLDFDSYGLEKVVPTRQRLIGLFFSIGTFLVILTMLGRIDERFNFSQSTFDLSRQIPAFATGGASTLLYFMLGLALLSQTQFISLHIRWNIQKIPINSKLARQWAGYSLLFLGVIALAVSLLPTSYSIQPLMILGYVINLIFYIFLIIGQSIYLFAVYLIGFLFALFGKDNPIKNPADMPAKAPVPLPEVGNSPIGPDWWEAIKMIVFWAIFLSVIFWAAREYLRQHSELLTWLRKWPAWRFLEQLINWLRDIFSEAKTNISNLISSERPRQAMPWQKAMDGFINLRKLTPRQRIYFFYLALVRRAGENGLPRISHQTPDEYAATLQSALPASADDVREMTAAFVHARYSHHPIEMEDSQRVENIWQRVRRALKGRRR